MFYFQEGDIIHFILFNLFHPVAVVHRRTLYDTRSISSTPSAPLNYPRDIKQSAWVNLCYIALLNFRRGISLHKSFGCLCSAGEDIKSHVASSRRINSKERQDRQEVERALWPTQAREFEIILDDIVDALCCAAPRPPTFIHFCRGGSPRWKICAGW